MLPLAVDVNSMKKTDADRRRGLGRSRGGLNTKVHAAVDASGQLAEMQVSPAYDGDETREVIKKLKAKACIKPSKNRKTKKRYDRTRYKNRNQVERFFNRIMGTEHVYNDLHFGTSYALTPGSPCPGSPPPHALYPRWSAWLPNVWRCRLARTEHVRVTWHCVPSTIASRRKQVDLFQRLWHRYVGQGEVVFLPRDRRAEFVQSALLEHGFEIDRVSGREVLR